MLNLHSQNSLKSLVPHFPLSPLVVSTVLCCSRVQLRPLPWELPLVPLQVLLAEAALQHREAGGAVLLRASQLSTLSSAGRGWCLSHQGTSWGTVGPLPQEGTRAQSHSSHPAECQNKWGL